MSMTHYMELLGSPLTLLLFMAIPIMLAETVAITELHVLYTRDFSGPVRQVNRAASIAVGIYFVGVFLYLMATAVVPLTSSGGWRGWIDVGAVGFYLAGVVPLGGLALLDLGLVARGRTEEQRLKLHAVCVALFLVVGHIAMILGMLDPKVGGWSPTGAAVHSSH